jgi:hypothetical protein
VDILNSCQDCRLRGKVTVIAWTFLPKMEDILSRPFSHSQLLQQRAVGLLQVLFHAIREWTLHCKEQSVYTSRRFLRKDEQMYILWHVNKGDQTKPLLDKSSINTF